MNNFYSILKLEDIVNIAIQGLSDSTLFSISILVLLKILDTNYELIVVSNSDKQKNLMSILKNLQNLAIHRKGHLFIYVNSLFTFLYIFGSKKNIIAPLFFKLCI